MNRTLKERVARILGDSATMLLRQRGFQKRGNVYAYMVNSSLAHLVDVQHSRWNDPREVRFTLNCGVYVPGVTSAFTNTPDPSRPSIVDCCVIGRAGLLKAPYLDTWWAVSSSTSAESDAETRTQLGSMIEGVILPFLRRFPDRRSVAVFLTEPLIPGDQHVQPSSDALRFAYAALIWRSLEDPAKCRECLHRAAESSRDTPLESVVEGFTSRISC